MTNKQIDNKADMLEQIKSELEDAQNEMQHSFNSKSEKWQESDAGQSHDARRQALEDASGTLESVISYLNDAKKDE